MSSQVRARFASAKYQSAAGGFASAANAALGDRFAGDAGRGVELLRD